jgi:poly-beta-1,6-N-acetyl-D-glucosamine biosynthesis protein PgaD
MNEVPRLWPPLIHANLPPWMKWRDAALTLGMWILFGFLLQRQFGLAQATYQDSSYLTDFLTRLSPYAHAALLLTILLAIAAKFTGRRLQRSFLLPEPAPLALSDQARRVGMDEAALAAARDLRIAVVYVDGEGRNRIVPR